MRLQRRMLALPMIAALATTAALAATVSGKVTDASGAPLDKVVIKLEPTSASQVSLTTKGTYIFGIVRGGDYHVKVEAEGYRVSAIELKAVDKDGKELYSNSGAIAPGAALPDLKVGELEDVTMSFTVTPSKGGGGEFGTGVALLGTGEVAKLIDAGKLDQARKEIQKGLDADPNDAKMYYLRAYLELKAGNLDDALAGARKSVELDPQLAGGRLLEGVILQRQGKDEDALRVFEDEIKNSQEPQVVHDAWVHVVIVSQKLGRTDEAKQALDKLMQLDPNDVVAYSQALELAIKTGDTAEAERIMAAAPAELQNDPVTHYNLGVQHWNAKDAEGAAKEFRRAIELKPDMADAYRMLGLTEANLGNLDEAVKNLERYIELAPNASDVKGLKTYVDTLKQQKSGGK